MTEKNELRIIAIALVILWAVFCTGLAIANIQAQTKLNAIKIVARHHAQKMLTGGRSSNWQEVENEKEIKFRGKA